MTGSLVLSAAVALPACGGDDTGDGAGGSSTETLSAPSDFMATFDATANAVHTSWAAGSGNMDMYMVMRVDQETTQTQMWQVPKTETTYDDTTAESGVTYVYMVHAMQGDMMSDPSNKVMVTIP